MTSPKTLFGWHTVEARLKKAPEQIQQIYLQSGRQDGRIKQLRALAGKQSVPITEVSTRELGSMVQGQRHQGVVAILRAVNDRATLTEAELEDFLDSLDHDPLLLILDGIQDPHNLGACLRVADGAGVDAVIIPKDKAVQVNATVSKVAAGAAEAVPVISVVNLARCMKVLAERGVWLAGLADEAAGSLYQADLKGALAIVMGSEDKGLRHNTRKHCDYLLNLPMYGSVSSLNVSVATGICLYEVLRQRHGLSASG